MADKSLVDKQRSSAALRLGATRVRLGVPFRKTTMTKRLAISGIKVAFATSIIALCAVGTVDSTTYRAYRKCSLV